MKRIQKQAESNRFVMLLIFLLSFMLPSLVLAQNQGAIRGKVTNGKIKSAENVRIYIDELNQKAVTNTSGDYQFSPLQPGQYTLVVNAEGIPEQRFPFSVHAGEDVVLNINLKNYSRTMREVIVTGSQEKLIRRESTSSSRLPISNMENPQVTSVVAKELLQQQVAADLGTALTNVPGAGVPVAFNQNRLVILSRGFSVQPKFRNSLATFIQTSIDPVDIERMEVIKGPSSTLFGASEVTYGGLINLITKKPYNFFGGEASYSLGSWNLNRLAVDINAPISQAKNVLFRMNAAGHTENSFQDFGFQKNIAFTPSISYQVNERLNVSVDVEYESGQGTSPVRFTPYTTKITSQNIAAIGIPYSTSFASNDMTYNSNSNNIILQFNYRFSDHWRSLTSVSRTGSSFDGYTSQLSGRSDSTLRAQVTVGKYEYFTTNIQQNFIGDFKIGNIRNRLVAGFDYYNYKQQRNTRNVNTGIVSFKKPLTTYYKTFNPYYVDSVAKTTTPTNTQTRENTYAVYFSNITNITPDLMVMYSLRLDRFESSGTYNANTATTTGKYGQTALSPKFGLVYQLMPQRLSLFANYMNGFTNQTGTDAQGNTFKPEQANQWEGGVKLDLFGDKLAGTISYYNIEVKDVLRTDPDDVNYSIQDGTQTSKGIEVDLASQPLSGWQIIAGYAYNDSRFKNIDKTLDGLRPAGSGPANQFNFWISYQVLRGPFAGLGIGFGGNYGDKSYQTKTTSTEVVIPSYFVLNSTLFYKYKNVRLAVKANNLTNEKYWSSRLAPQKPFNLIGNVTFSF